MVRARADLHTHSVLSDGTDTPTELVQLADKLGLGGLALSDHDTIAGLQEFMTAEASPELLRVPGLELSTDFDSQEVHILGYFIPMRSAKLQARLEDLQQRRHKKFSMIVEKLQELGIELEQSEIDAILENVESPGRPHLAHLLTQKGIVRTIDDAFDLYLGEGKPAYVTKERMHAFDAINLILSVGAVPVLAHPLTVEVPDMREFIRKLADAGLRGVEVEYDYGTMGITEGPASVRSAIHGLDLIETGGSDYHGESWMGNLGSVTVPIEVIGRLKVEARESNT
ncbi:MAG: PHP domain-containing protein [Candidatus Thorarchaeota archaeon]